MAQQNTTNGRICAEEYTVKRGDSFYLIAHKLGVPLRDLLAANSNIHPARLMVGDVLCVPREEDDSNGGLGSGGNGSAGSTGSGGTGTGGAGSGSTGSTGNISGSTGSAGGSVSGGIAGSGGSTDGQSQITGTPSGGGGASGGTGGTGGGTSGGTGGGAVTCPIDDQLIVQRGQTIADIQLLNLVSRHTLEQANPNIDLDALRVGQTLCVPKDNVPCPVPTTYTLGATETLEAVAVQFNLPVASILRANPCLAPQDFEPGVTVVIPR